VASPHPPAAPLGARRPRRPATRVTLTALLTANVTRVAAGPCPGGGTAGPTRRLPYARPVVLSVHVAYDERYWYPDEGGQVWLAGYQLVDADSGRYLAREAPELAARGLRVVGVAGAGAHHADALGGDGAAPGSPLELRRDRGNPHDPNAIAVHERHTGDQVGWVPREVAAELAPELDAGRPWAAVVLREQRRSPRDPRHGLTMLLAQADAIELVGAV
jgi:hypothetical protein